MCDECEGRWALVRTLGGQTLKNPAEKQEPGKEGKHWGGERRERRVPETGLCFKEKRGSLTAGNKTEGSRPDKDTEYSPDLLGVERKVETWFSGREQKANCCWLRSD